MFCSLILWTCVSSAASIFWCVCHLLKHHISTVCHPGVLPWLLWWPSRSNSYPKTDKHLSSCSNMDWIVILKYHQPGRCFYDFRRCQDNQLASVARLFTVSMHHNTVVYIATVLFISFTTLEIFFYLLCFMIWHF